MEERTIRRHSMRTIVFHWAFSGFVVILVVTGIAMFIPGRGAGGGYATGIIHRAAAVGFLASPLVYSLLSPRSAIDFLKETLRWGKDDLRWFMTAPDYYFGGSGGNMPHQDRLNAGQKMWQLVLVGTDLVFLITGIVMWLFRSSITVTAYEWVLFGHGTAFVIFMLMLLVHLYMSVLHPHMGESIYSMIDGKVSASYAREHHRKWYDRIVPLGDEDTEE